MYENQNIWSVLFLSFLISVIVVAVVFCFAFSVCLFFGYEFFNFFWNMLNFKVIKAITHKATQ